MLFSQDLFFVGLSTRFKKGHSSVDSVRRVLTFANSEAALPTYDSL
jgi:hypothetical protein